MTAQRPRILVADDQPDNLLVLEEMLEALYQVQTVGNGQELLEAVARDGAPDLILLDVVMPLMSGFDACRALKADPAKRDIPIIFLSGLESPADEEAGLLLGAEDFIRKPFVAASVLVRVRNLLARKEAAANEREMAVMFSQLEEQKHFAEAQAKMIDMLSEMNSELERFAYVAAHDLREPCRTVVNYGQLLRKLYADCMDEAGRQYLENVVTAARWMYDLVGGLLSFSRSPANLEVSQPVHADEVMLLAMEGLAELKQRTGAEVIVEPLPSVLADRMALVQIFQHLVGNAMKYHKPDIPPKVRVFAKADSEMWHFTVSDNGIGFDSQLQDPFALFRRLHHASGEGMGIVSVCKRLIQAMGGQIWAVSNPGLGSHFHFTLKSAPER